MNEEWRPVVGREGEYEVSSLGRVRGLDRLVHIPASKSGRIPAYERPWKGRIMMAKMIPHTGYMQVLLGGRKHCYVHRLVAAAWIGPLPNGYQVNHIDGDKQNNIPENLEYVTASENIRHAMANGLFPNYGESHATSKYSDELIRKAVSLHVDDGVSQRAASLSCGLHKNAVWDVIHGRKWRHLGLFKKETA